MATRSDDGESILYENKERRFDQLGNKMAELKQSGSLCDVQLKVKDKLWSVHKVVLVSMATYFQVMFCQDLKEKNQEVIELDGLEVESAELLISYAYTGILKISRQNVMGLFNTADMWGVEDIKDKCADFMSTILDTSNCLEFLLMAETHGYQILLSKCRAFIKANYSNFSINDDLMQLDYDQLIKVIGPQTSDIKPSVPQLHESINRWINYNLKEFKKQFIQILSVARLDTMTEDTFKEIVNGEILFQSSNELKDCITQTLFDRLFIVENQFENPKKGLKTYVFDYHDKQIYDPSKKMFASVEPSEKRFDHAVTTMDGNIFFMGGQNRYEYFSSCEMFDPIQNRWTTMAPMFIKKRSLAACSLNGLVYVSGGISDDKQQVHAVECFDPIKNNWTSVTPMNFHRSGHKMIAFGNCIYAIGGGDGQEGYTKVERYDPRTRKWEPMESMEKCGDAFGAAVSRGKLYVARSEGDPKVECYDPTSGSWQSLAPYNYQRFYGTLVDVDGILYLFGGNATAECYDPETNTWTHHHTRDEFKRDEFKTFNCDKISTDIKFKL